MVQRKDSMSYVEFIRGKYMLEKRCYIMKLLSNMTQEEHDALRSKCFDDLWKCLWQVHECRNFMKEYQEAKKKFEALKKGYYLQDEEHNKHFFSLDSVLDAVRPGYSDTEWGFPKGRRNINEDDLSCAIREFCEETGYHKRNLQILVDQKPFEEVFSGTNKVRYRHIYFLALFVGERTSGEHVMNKTMMKEIKKVQWFDYRAAQDHVRAHNVERKELFKRVHQIIVKMCTK